MTVYYNPAALGLKVVAEIDYTDGNYQFDFRVVWKHESGKFYTGRDAGCSCPSPFEDYESLDKFDELTDLTPLREEVQLEVTRHTTLQKGADFLRAVLVAMA